jgi:hypothetical protein
MGFDLGNIVDNVVTALVGGGTGWFFGRRGNNAAAAVTEGDAIIKMQESYKTFVEDANERFTEMRSEIKELHDNLGQVRELDRCKKMSGLSKK